MRRLKLLTWHTHGSYLQYLSHAPHDFHVLAKPDRQPGDRGSSGGMPWRGKVHELPVEHARHQEFDRILFHGHHQWEKHQFEFLGPAQRALPRICLEHDPPLAHSTGTRRTVDDPGVLLVHVSPFHVLMWDSGRTPVRVIENGVSGYTATDPQALPGHMQALLDDPALGRRLGEGERRTARGRFPTGRFSSDRDAALRHVSGLGTARQEPAWN